MTVFWNANLPEGTLCIVWTVSGTGIYISCREINKILSLKPGQCAPLERMFAEDCLIVVMRWKVWSEDVLLTGQ
jgi:hypothetical protein